MTDTERIEAARVRYLKAGHAIQSAIKVRMEVAARQHVPEDTRFTSPKHLRVGLDLRAADAAGLARLLIEKGIITEVEYFEAVADAAEKEQAEQTESASACLGFPVTFG